MDHLLREGYVRDAGARNIKRRNQFPAFLDDVKGRSANRLAVGADSVKNADSGLLRITSQRLKLPTCQQRAGLSM